MRLALVVPAFPKLSETFIVSKFLGLLDRGWDVHVVCGASDQDEWRRFPALSSREDVRRRVHVSPSVEPRVLLPLRWPMAVGTLLGNPRTSWRYASRGLREDALGLARRAFLDAALVRLGPDLIHFEFGALAVGRMHLKHWLGCRLTCSFRGYDLNFAGLEDAGYYDEVWRGADGFHLLGQDLWQRALRRGCPPAKLHALIPPAIDTQLFSPPPREEWGPRGGPDRPLRILSVGRLEWKKGYEYGLQAVARLAAEGVASEYRIIGGGTYLEALAFARHQLGVEREVQFLGAQSAEVVRRELAWADVFLHAAVSEGYCNSVLEAQAMAVPVVCSDAGGLPENVASGETGYVVPRRDPKALAEKLMPLARDPELRRRLGVAGRDRVMRLYRLEDQIAAFDQFYRRVLQSN